jgi:hypothetical protein
VQKGARMKNLAFAIFALCLSGYEFAEAAQRRAIGEMLAWFALWIAATATVYRCYCKEPWCFRPRCMHGYMRSIYCRKHLQEMQAIWWMNATADERQRAIEVETSNAEYRP